MKGGAQITAKLPTAAKNLVNAIAESPVSGSMSSQLGAVGDLGRLGGGAKGTTPTVTAEGRIGNSVFTDVNQTARPAAQANPNQPTLIADCGFHDTWTPSPRSFGHSFHAHLDT